MANAPLNITESPAVSVVVPTYNRRGLIGETIKSILSQTYINFEMIIVDDGSTDGTREYVLDSFGGDHRLRYVTQSNSERAVARNRGIRESRGEYVAFLDSDDLWLPAKLERQVSALTTKGAPPCCYCWFDVCGSEQIEPDSARSELIGDIFEPLLNDCFIGSMTPLIRRSCFDVVGGFCEDRRLLCFEDWEMWTRLASRFRWTLVPEILGSHRLHAGNTQHAPDVFVDEIRIRLKSSYKLSPNQKAAFHHYAAARRWHWATKLFADEPRVAMQSLLRLAMQCPSRAMDRSFWGLFARTASRIASCCRQA